MDESIEDSSTLNDSNTINENIAKERTDDGDGNVKELDHLNDHDYFTATPKKPSKATIKKQCKRLLKITQIKAVYNCKCCGYRTMNKERLTKHHCGLIKTEPCTKCDSNKVPKGYKKCPNCTYISRSTVSLKNHMRIHEKGNPYKCTECDFSGKDCRSLILHYCRTRNLQCICGYRTHVKKHFENHLRSHTGLKPHSCAICSFTCVDKAVLAKHISKKHNTV